MIQLGGAIVKQMNIIDPFSILILTVFVFLLKCYLVQWSYNTIFPLIRYNAYGDEEQPFIPLTLTHSIILVILCNNLFVM